MQRDETYTLISVNDPAVDTTKITIEKMLEYINDRDESIIANAIDPAQPPARFTCREVPRKFWSRFVMEGRCESDNVERAFRAGVRSVVNLMGDDGVRNEERWDVPDEIMAIESVDRFTPAQVQEIGSVIYQRSFLGHSIKRDWLLPPMCHDALADREFLRAESSPNSQAQPSSGTASASQDTPPPPAGGTATDTDASGASSASPTGATAQASASSEGG